ncbi:hypothetical protein F383_29896 [Gossypium arboreum]|uniref:Uncharacterized protein n=1 Tax=Gossypium arboreum TaxID=29729 RepID=A0A0B0MV04_GOSAR|nr:hypothetical protein F383_29896 [Gossypium arboreum]
MFQTCLSTRSKSNHTSETYFFLTSTTFISKGIRYVITVLTLKSFVRNKGERLLAIMMPNIHHLR